MTSVSIDVDGKIDLTDLAEAVDVPGRSRADTDRIRNSRLADVMIVMERGRDALEESLRARLTERVLPDGLTHLTLELDDAAPRFAISLEPVFPPESLQIDISASQRALLETEIANEVAAWIEQRAMRSPTPRWQPQIKATVRSAGEAVEEAQQARLKSTWLRILFWLLASVILATVYLYLKGMPS